MKTIAPDYYLQFRCIADKCRHSCCIGWEIDIDSDTREKYRCISGAFGKQLNAAIDDGEVASFHLGPDERCPMLNANGLCDLITELGEDALCQICADHPRFRNFYADRTELGLGLCCEEAARLILTQEAPMQLIPLEEDGQNEALSEEDEALLAIRDTLIHVMQDDSRPLAERLDEVLLLGGRRIPDLDWAAVFRDLERLDPAWDDALDTLPTSLADSPTEGAPKVSKGRSESPLVAAEDANPLQTAWRNFMVYLLYRHLPGAMEDDDIPGRVAFCVLSTRMLMALCAAHEGCTLEDCVEYARMYSAEIEYSEDNIAALLDALWED